MKNANSMIGNIASRFTGSHVFSAYRNHFVKCGGRSKSGMTLMEVMIVTFISSLLIAGILSGVLTANRLNYAHAQRVAAFSLCLERLEKMRATAYSEITPDNPDFSTVLTNFTHLGGSQQVPLEGELGSDIVPQQNPERLEVTTWLQWTNRTGGQREQINGIIYPRE